jgi:hypothetical protein
MNIEINDEASYLAYEIAKFYNDAVPHAEMTLTTDFTDKVVWQKYLKDTPIKVQEIIHKAHNYAPSISKEKLLNNFINMCINWGMKLNNPFSYFIYCTENYNAIIEGKLQYD